MRLAFFGLVLSVLCLGGCRTPGAVSLKNCELAQLPAEQQALASSVATIALDPGSAVSDLETLALAVGKAQFVCVVQAVQAWISNSPPANPGTELARALVAASVDVRQQHALDVLSQYLAKVRQ